MNKLSPGLVDASLILIVGLSAFVHVGFVFCGMTYDPFHTHTICHAYENFWIFTLIIHVGAAGLFIADAFSFWTSKRTLLAARSKFFIVCVPVLSAVIWQVLFTTVPAA